MVIVLDGKGPEASLPDMAARVIVLVVAADMSGEQPAHVSTQIAVDERPEREVEMTGHQRKCQQAHGGVFGGLAEEFAKGGEIAVFVKDSAPGIAPVRTW